MTYFRTRAGIYWLFSVMPWQLLCQPTLRVKSSWIYLAKQCRHKYLRAHIFLRIFQLWFIFECQIKHWKGSLENFLNPLKTRFTKLNRVVQTHGWSFHQDLPILAIKKWLLLPNTKTSCSFAIEIKVKMGGYFSNRNKSTYPNSGGRAKIFTGAYIIRNKCLLASHIS